MKSIYALPGSGAMAFRRLSIAVAVLLVVGGGLFGAEVWHNFVWFAVRSQASEARVTLERLCRAQLRRMNDGGSPATRYRELGEEVERGNRYAYLIGPGSQLVVPSRVLISSWRPTTTACPRAARRTPGHAARCTRRG